MTQKNFIQFLNTLYPLQILEKIHNASENSAIKLLSLYKIVYPCIDEVLDFLNNFHSKFYFISTNLDFFGVCFALASLEQKNTPKKSRFVSIK